MILDSSKAEMMPIGLIKDAPTRWWLRFEESLSRRGLPYRLIEIERDGWLEDIEPCDFIIWRPNLQPPYLAQAREKLYVMENLLGKTVYPNRETFWHYDNKNAQIYMMRQSGIKSPPSFVSYSYEESLDYLKKSSYPIVSKASGGAGSVNVRLLGDFGRAKTELDRLFNRGMKNRIRTKLLAKLGLAGTRYDSQTLYVHYQEFIPGNTRDFRVTTIGDDHVFCFYRRNRKNDFRASGSGRIEYDSEPDMRAVRYCLDLSRRLRFDSMCYDILFRGDDYFICEMSYIFDDRAIFDCPGHYRDEKGTLRYHEGHVWPQELIIEFLAKKWKLPAHGPQASR